ncbi:beta-N-acetylhexosaminidase [Aromatoleum aromaticum]|uniref:Beta-hexosaminidase n=1 Tax=Aromatoleum aromaticum (strain DSM 19018 / LMG 30748 / EbN1) TaxID=76114 RepID=NAGZ_AROAE|nr:beta-N-acetylhexosaminidase [Aromatoleum aromaticum]Q5P081.1 RecName: Full=Beta-hexosaminidase; AltName: Full=Beta-N-acetylhexosaminidase; AltName: Full=N-acetyl-beta-glucosaminidase [Aromatoleum aromaticum EbN1]NMG55398.1 beta-N-acetylhexosaminidase [Aromatoleum aromaticum]CAI09283.1 putative beta-hexosaminidase [Aromatoleum aromaticum EbN1]
MTLQSDLPATVRPLGPVMLDVAGFALTEEERERLLDPLVGGVILFARNFRDSEQLQALTAEIHALRSPALIIAVDHEGGRVQRFRTDGFTRIPSMRCLGRLWERDHVAALESARCAGYVLAAELLAHGVDLSFTPVLDLDYGCSRVVGDRAFHRDPLVVAALAQSLVSGMADAGMGCVGKHFPGHGYAEADSHVEIPVDEREFDAIWTEDIAPYRHRLGRQLAGVMPAHVIYPRVDPNPAGFSRFWLQDILRGRVGFGGVIFSDDLTMEGATVVGDILARARAAFGAGCDVVLVCNRPDLAVDLLDRWAPDIAPESRARIEALRSRPQAADPFALELHPVYRQARDVVAGLVEDTA